MAGPADTTAQIKNTTTRYVVFIVLPPLVDGYELLDRAFKLGTNPLKKIRYFTLPEQTTSACAKPSAINQCFRGHFRRRYNWADSGVRRQSIVSSRRDFLKIASFATACVAARGTVLAAAEEPALGLIFPPLNYPIPPDAKRLYPAGVRFLGDGVGLSGGMTIDGYEEAIPRLIPAAERLAKQGAERLKIFLQEHGFDVTFAKGLGCERIPEGGATQEILFKLGADTYAKSKKADALVISCGALRTLDLIVPLEIETKVPVVSSTPHGLMNGVRMLGISPRAKGFGMVFEKV